MLASGSKVAGNAFSANQIQDFLVIRGFGGVNLPVTIPVSLSDIQTRTYRW
jgi:hypothetical protein